MNARVDQAGVDTWAPCWYHDVNSDEGQVLTARATVKTARGWMLPEPVGGHRVIWNGSTGLLKAEGHPRRDALCPPAALPGALVALVEELLAAGVPVPNGRSADVWDAAQAFEPGPGSLWRGERVQGFAGCGRVDGTVNVRMPSSAAGLAAMGALAGLARAFSPTAKVDITLERGVVQTVVLMGTRAERFARIYDKGVESGTAPPGRLLRLEDQRRYDKGSRRGVTELTAAYVRGKFEQRFVPLWKASKGVKVGGPMVLADKLADMVECGELKPAEARRIAGALVMETVGATRRGLHGDRTTAWRIREKARELGLVLSEGNGLLEEVEVDVRDVLEQALSTDAWERRG